MNSRLRLWNNAAIQTYPLQLIWL